MDDAQASEEVSLDRLKNNEKRVLVYPEAV